MYGYILNDEYGISDKLTFDAVRASMNKTEIIPMISKISIKKAARLQGLVLCKKKLEVENPDFLKFFPQISSLSVKGPEILGS